MEKKYFHGNEISEEGLKYGYVDYKALAESFDGVLNNNIIPETTRCGFYWEQESGFIDNYDKIEELQKQIEHYQEQIEALEENIENKVESYIEEQIEILNGKIETLKEQIEDLEYEQDYPPEIYQYYIVSDNGASILKDANEIVFYNEEIDMYVWGVTHWGTLWSGVLTNIKIDW